MWPSAGIAACLQISFQAVYPRMSAEDSDNPSKIRSADVSNPEPLPLVCDDVRDVYEHIKDFKIATHQSDNLPLLYLAVAACLRQ